MFPSKSNFIFRLLDILKYRCLMKRKKYKQYWRVFKKKKKKFTHSPIFQIPSPEPKQLLINVFRGEGTLAFLTNSSFTFPYYSMLIYFSLANVFIVFLCMSGYTITYFCQFPIKGHSVCSYVLFGLAVMYNAVINVLLHLTLKTGNICIFRKDS